MVKELKIEKRVGRSLRGELYEYKFALAQTSDTLRWLFYSSLLNRALSDCDYRNDKSIEPISLEKRNQHC